MRGQLTVLLAMCLLVNGAWAQRIEISWPTPSRAFDEGKPISAFLQQAGSGDPTSGGFGGVRSNGRQFHEGIDIQPVKRDARGEPADPIFAAMDGVVRYVNKTAGDSSYGRYVVLEHPTMKPAIYTLYGHLAQVEPAIKAGVVVRRGDTLGKMGRSASYTIPRDRAHLHFEMGLWLSRDFQSWYDWKKFGSRNGHGLFNGYNLTGFDPLDFFREYRARRVDNFQDYLTRMPAVVTVRIATNRRPDFVDRYPSLMTKHLPMFIVGWEVVFNATGLPIRWTPLDAADVKGMRPNEVRVTQVNAELEKRDRSKSQVAFRQGHWEVGSDLKSTLQLLFSLRK